MIGLSVFSQEAPGVQELIGFFHGSHIGVRLELRNPVLVGHKFIRGFFVELVK